jgi:hypothetical protein
MPHMPWIRAKTAARAAAVPACAAALALVMTPHAGRADTFQKVSYDGSADELVITMIYRGTNADHQFSVKWGPCVDGDDGGHSIVGEVLDQQFQDAARKNFKKTVRISVADLDCRPAAVTLRTAPRFLYTLTIPARTSQSVRP